MLTIDGRLATGSVEGNRNWYFTKTNRHTMALIQGPIEFKMGSSSTEKNRQLDEIARWILETMPPADSKIQLEWDDTEERIRVMYKLPFSSIP